MILLFNFKFWILMYLNSKCKTYNFQNRQNSQTDHDATTAILDCSWLVNYWTDLIEKSPFRKNGVHSNNATQDVKVCVESKPVGRNGFWFNHAMYNVWSWYIYAHALLVEIKIVHLQVTKHCPDFCTIGSFLMNLNNIREKKVTSMKNS